MRSIGFSYLIATGLTYSGAGDTLPMGRTPWIRIQEAMRDKGLNPTQAECAGLLGVRQPSVSEWASGETAPSIENARKLAKKLNVCVEWILTEQGPKRPGPPMEPEAQAVWDAWGRVPPDDRGRVVGFVEALARPFQPKPAKRTKLASAR